MENELPNCADAASIDVLWLCLGMRLRNCKQKGAGSIMLSVRSRGLLLRELNKGETDEKTRFHQIFGLGSYGCTG